LNKQLNLFKEIEIPFVNQIINGNCIDRITEIPNDSINITITSPPYNIGINYSDYTDSKTEIEYKQILSTLSKELYRVTVNGGRLCLNIPFANNSNFGKKKNCITFYPIFYLEIFKEWIPREFIIWVKTTQAENPDNFCGNKLSWGSWCSPTSPYLRSYAECILVLNKKFSKLKSTGISDLTKKEFMMYTKNVWYIPSAQNKSHPAIYPVELPKRLIKLYTWVDDIVLDPFAGTGTTAIASIETNRRYIGFEISTEYCNFANNRIIQFSKSGSSAATF